MEKDKAPGDHIIEMSNIEEDGNASSNKASADFSFEPTTMKQPEGGSQTENGKTHEDRDPTSDKGSFKEKWLQSVSVKKGTTLHNNLVSFLTFVGIDDDEGLEALATSFDDIVIMIDNEFNAYTLMKLRNYLWHTTGMPCEMRKEATIADMLSLLKFKCRKDNRTIPQKPIVNDLDERQPLAYTGQSFSGINRVNGDVSYQVQTDGNRRRSPENHNITQDGRRKSDFYRAEDLIYATPRRDGSDGTPEATAWGSFPL